MSPSMRANIEKSKRHIRAYEAGMTFQEKVLQEQFALVRRSLSEEQLALVVTKMYTRG